MVASGNRSILQLTTLDEGGDCFYRLRWPAAHLASLEPNWRVINLDCQARERFEWGEAADVLILVQCADLEMLPVIQDRKRRGKKTLVELNDNFYQVVPWSPVAKEWSSPLTWANYETIARASDALIVTSEALKDLFAPKFPSLPIHILENHFPHSTQPLDEIVAKRAEAADNSLAIGWGGSQGHMADFLHISEFLGELLRESPHVRLHVMGNKSIPELTHFPKQQFFFTPWSSIHDYFSFWKPVQIGIVPLLDTPYNQCRSDIKAIEMSALGVLPLLPDAKPYQNFIRTTGIKPYKNLAHLKEILGEYMLRPERIHQDVKICYDYVNKERLLAHDRKRRDLIAHFLPKDSELCHWPCERGYLEHCGTPQEKTSTSEALAVADSFLKLKQHTDALRTLQRARFRNQAVPELALAELRTLRIAGDPALGEQLEQSIQRFPLDVRFLLLKVQWASDSASLNSGWDQLLTLLETQPRAFADFFAPQTVKLLLVQGQADPNLLLPIAERLSALLPNSGELRFFLAHAYEASGRTALALEQFSWLARQSEIYTKSSIFSSLDLSYLQAWCSALAARSQAS